MEIEKQVRELLEPIIVENGYYLSDVMYVQEDKNYFLRIIIDKDGIITLDDCVKVNNLINPLLDEKDLISDSYILDVCSKEKGGA